MRKRCGLTRHAVAWLDTLDTWKRCGLTPIKH